MDHHLRNNKLHSILELTLRTSHCLLLLLLTMAAQLFSGIHYFTAKKCVYNNTKPGAMLPVFMLYTHTGDRFSSPSFRQTWF